ncbi:hypothetical protein DFH28DRAFT_1137000 [Melampsora americana]|nr:hypothetical protein DFH28DRAFT_1137000 [Melampsora americana]
MSSTTCVHADFGHMAIIGPFSHIELDSPDEENEDKEEHLQIDNNDNNNDNVDLPEPDHIFHSEDDIIIHTEEEATTTKAKQSNAKEIELRAEELALDNTGDEGVFNNITKSNDQTEDGPVGRELEDTFHFEDEVPLASIKATKAKRPRGRPTKRREEPPKELKIAPPKPSTTTESKRSRAKPAKCTTQDTEDTMENMSLDKNSFASLDKTSFARAVEPAKKKLRGWKGWAIVEENLKKEEDVDDVNDDTEGNSDGGGIKLRRTKHKRA